MESVLRRGVSGVKEKEKNKKFGRSLRRRKRKNSSYFFTIFHN